MNIDKFISKTKVVGDCLEWQEFRMKNGYGQGRHNGKTWLAHRLSWVLHNGKIPDGLCVLHKCDNRPCVAPDHLFLGTIADNNRDASKKGRSAFGDRNGLRKHPHRNPSILYPERRPRGERVNTAKLNELQVREIRIKLSAGLSSRIIAKIYGVRNGTICFIKAGKTWKHVLA